MICHLLSVTNTFLQGQENMICNSISAVLEHLKIKAMWK